MLILGAIFNCLDPILTVVAGLSARDPFLMPFDKKDVSTIWLLSKKLYQSDCPPISTNMYYLETNTSFIISEFLTYLSYF